MREENRREDPNEVRALFEKAVRERVAALGLRGDAELDVTEEMTQHLGDRYREYCSGGMEPDKAYRKAVAEIEEGWPPGARVARMPAAPADDRPGSGNLLEEIWKDLRYATRTMRKSPVFVLFVVAALALGIGANTTVFTVINTLILNPLPVERPSELAALSMAKQDGKARANALFPLSYADLNDYRNRNRSFDSLAGYTSVRVITLQGNSGSEQRFCELATANYFSTLGLRPARGRFFLPDEDRGAGSHAVAVMNYGTWQTRFGGNPKVIGETLRLNQVVFTVVGVAPPSFIGVNAIFGPDFWIPAGMMERLFPNEMANGLTDRAKTVFTGVGRLKAGVSRAQAQAQFEAVAGDLARAYPLTNTGHSAAVRPLSDVLFGSASGSAPPIVFASAGLLAVVGIVLLIACSNVANLLLARSAARSQEMAIRLALGASRRRLIRQLLTESVFLGLLSGLAGFLIAIAGLRALFGTLPGWSNFIQPKFDVDVFLFALLISLATGLLFGTLPALKASRANVSDALKEESRTVGRSRRKISVANVLLVGQVGFSFLLLVTAALFLRSIGRAYAIDPGFQTAHLAVFMTNPGQAGLGKAQSKAFYRDVRERVGRMPEVESISWSSNLPLWSRTATGLEIEGKQRRSAADQLTSVVNTVDTGYFETAGVRLDRGRGFTKADTETSTPVAVINEKMARDYWPEGDALGKRIQLPGEKQMRQLVGVARTANYTNWAEPPQLCVYLPLEQHYVDGMTLYVRSKADPQRVLDPVQRAVREQAPQVLTSGIRTGRQILDGGLFQAKMGVALLSVFGLLALALASIGLYGIMAYSVNQRQREIGLRMALGAEQGKVLLLVLKQGMTLVLTGVGVGMAAALLTGRLLSRMLYGMSGSDPVSVGGAAMVLLAVALVACYLPARRASRVDPLVALRAG